MESVTIDNANPDWIVSPIQPLIRGFLTAPWIWLPERQDEILRIQVDHQIQILIDATDHTFRFSAKSEAKRIRIGLTALERVWCYTFGLLKIYNCCRTLGCGKLIEASELPELTAARCVLGSALTSERNKTPIKWQRGMPCPLFDGELADVQKTYPVFIAVAAFLLLHEIGHIVLNHPTEGVIFKEDVYRQEFEADMWAVRFIMDKLSSYNTSLEHFVARANGIVLGLCLLSSVELKDYQSATSDHPSIPERLLRFFDKYLPDSDEPAGTLKDQPKFMAATVLDAFLLNNKIEIDYAKEHANFFDPIIDLRKYFPG